MGVFFAVVARDLRFFVERLTCCDFCGFGRRFGGAAPFREDLNGRCVAVGLGFCRRNTLYGGVLRHVRRVVAGPGDEVFDVDVVAFVQPLSQVGREFSSGLVAVVGAFFEGFGDNAGEYAVDGIGQRRGFLILVGEDDGVGGFALEGEFAGQ